MMIMLIFLLIFTAISFSLLTHPLSLGGILLIHTITIALFSGTLCLNYWYSYILFLIMIGGMLVLFMYMTSIAPNEKFSFSSKLMFTLLSLMIMTTIMFILDPYFLNMNYSINDLKMFFCHSNYKISLVKFMIWPSNLIFFMLIFYLLITLIMVVKITYNKTGPLRQKF